MAFRGWLDIVGVIGSSPTNPTKKRQVLHGPVFSWSDSQHAIRSPAIVGTIGLSPVNPARLAIKKQGVAVTYSSGTSSSSVSVRTDPADLPVTSFGLQLPALLRLYDHSAYVP